MYVRSSSKAVTISPSEVLEVLKSIVTCHTYYDMATTMVALDFSELLCLVCHAGPSTILHAFTVFGKCLNCSVADKGTKRTHFRRNRTGKLLYSIFGFKKFQIELFSALAEQLMM